MTQPSPDTAVADLVIDRPARARVFERLGIDYCCGGDHSLTEACRKNDLDPDTVVRMLDATEESPSDTDTTDWSEATLGDLIDHITSTHHDYLRRELPRLDDLLADVTNAHGHAISWLSRVQSVFRTLKADLFDHMRSEEEYVFPAIRTLEEGRVLPDGSTLEHATLEQMEAEHDDAGTMLEQLRDLTDGYTPPEGACPKFRAALDGLRELETDMHQHVHKENNVLFPKARSLA